jgi:hypothetical protein
MYVLKQVIEKCRFLTFEVNFLCQKLSESFQKKFSLKNIILGACLLLLTLIENFNFKLNKIMTIFCQLDLEFWYEI